MKLKEKCVNCCDQCGTCGFVAREGERILTGWEESALPPSMCQHAVCKMGRGQMRDVMNVGAIPWGLHAEKRGEYWWFVARGKPDPFVVYIASGEVFQLVTEELVSVGVWV